MGWFDILNDYGQGRQPKKTPGLFDGLGDGCQDPLRRDQWHPTCRHQEAYSDDAEAEEDGFFDENL